MSDILPLMSPGTPDDVGVKCVQSSFDGYEKYPMNLARYDCLTTNGEALNDKLSSLSETLFCSPSKPISVDVFDIDGSSINIIEISAPKIIGFDQTFIGLGSSDVSHFTFSETKLLEDHLASPRRSPRVKVMYEKTTSGTIIGKDI